MIAQHPDLGTTVEALGAPLRDPSWVDDDGTFVWVDGEAVFGFGKHKGRPLRLVAAEHRDSSEWLVTQDVPADVKRILDTALCGAFPVPAEAPGLRARPRAPRADIAREVADP